MKLGKWIGGGLGWALFGPIGAIFGFAAGAIIDSDNFSTKSRYQTHTTQGDFIASLLVLIAAVMKADGTIKRSELEYVKDFLRQSLGEAAAQDALISLRNILRNDIPIEDVCRQINLNLDYSSKLQLIHLLIGVAQADKEISSSENELIKRIAILLQLNASTFESLLNVNNPVQDAYKVLEVSPNASNEEIKKAYRRLANEHHPDKVSYLGEELQKKAKEKFQKINEAYDIIKKERGIK